MSLIGRMNKIYTRQAKDYCFSLLFPSFKEMTRFLSCIAVVDISLKETERRKISKSLYLKSTLFAGQKQALTSYSINRQKKNAKEMENLRFLSLFLNGKQTITHFIFLLCSVSNKS